MLGDLLLERGAIKKGNFVLSSGKTSDSSADLKEFCTDVSNLRIIVDRFSEEVKCDAVAGVELGAVPLVVGVALKLGLPYTIIRKERSHGNTSLIIGENISGKNVAILEDVVTTGGSVLKAVSLLREKGAIVTDVYCVLDREDGGSDALEHAGVKLHPLLRISEVFRK